MRLLAVSASVLTIILHATCVRAFLDGNFVSAQPPVLSPYQLVKEDQDAPTDELRPTFQELTALYSSPNNDDDDKIDKDGEAPVPAMNAPTNKPPAPSPVLANVPPPSPPRQCSPYNISKSKYISGIGGYAFMRIKMGFMKLYDLLHLFWYPLSIIGSILAVVVILYILKYRRLIKARKDDLDSTRMTDLMVRVKDPKDGMANFRVLELTPAFRQKYEKDWKLQSMGEYLSCLRPKALPDGVDPPKVVQRELERFLAASLIGYLGPRIGSAVLPMLGFSNIQSTTARIAGKIASWFASHFIVAKADVVHSDPTLDKGTLPFSLFDLSAFANLNEKFGSRSMEKTPLELMKHGEVGYSPSFDDDLIPNPFRVDRHWDRALRMMESRMSEESQRGPTVAGAEGTPDHADEFDPYDKSLPPPTPVNPRLFPGLHLGWGDAKCTHTKREIVRHRLFCVLMNKLNYNYYNREQKGITKEFVVVMDGNKITKAHEFVEALLDSGHEVEVCPKGNFTTFGIGACVKEKDGSFTNIPLAYFLRTGYESADSRTAHIGVPHSGMCMVIKGPLVGKSDKCNLQFYMAIDGMCGWNSNHNADVPWVVQTASTAPYSRENSLRAVRIAGLLAVTFNAIGTEMNLPYGGYGVLGVCNDTAALLDQSIRGKTNMYPLVSTGRYLMHIAKRLVILRDKLVGYPSLKEEVMDILRMIAATMDIPSDLHAAPSNVMDASHRYLSCLAKTTVFELEAESKEIITNILHKFEEYGEKRPEMEKNWKWSKMRSKRKFTN